MIRQLIIGLCALLLTIFSIGTKRAYADSWLPPVTTTYVSKQGQYRVVVVPRNIQSPLRYFESKVGNLPISVTAGPIGRLERFNEGRWQSVWLRGLINEVAPAEAIVSDDGRYVVTFDNWYSVGRGDHVLVIYAADGALVRSMRLDEIIPAYYIDALSSSVSSTYWKVAEPRFVAPSELELTMATLGADGIKRDNGYSIRLSLLDGRVAPLSAKLATQMSTQACSAHRKAVTLFNLQLERERSNLAPFQGKNRAQWQPYLYQAIQRSTPAVERADSSFAYSPFELLADGEYMEDEFRSGFIEALVATKDDSAARWFASRDQDKMVRQIQSAAKRIKPGQLVGVELRFLVDAARWVPISDALENSGAKLVHIDIGIPIPPRAENLAKLPLPRKLDPACV